MTIPNRTTDFAAPVDRTLHESSDRPAADRFSHSSAVPAGASVDLVKFGRPVDTVDRAFHPAFPATRVVPVHALGPIPGTVPAIPYEPHRPFQHLPGPSVVAFRSAAPSGPGIGLDAAHAAGQLVTVAHSKARLDRARSYADRLGSHLAEVHAKLTAAAEHQVGAAIGTAEPDPSDVGSLRGEAVDVDRQHRQALTILADVEAEHARHEADLAILFGSDGAARGKLGEAHAARALVRTAAADAGAILDRAKAHAEAVDGKLLAAQAEEARHDADATARLHAALRDGDAPPRAAEPFARNSPSLEDDLRTARATIDKLATEHAARIADLTAADLVVKRAVDQVLCADADAVARELQATDARTLALRVRLHAYTKRIAGDYVPPKTAPNKTLPNGMVVPDPAHAQAALQAPRMVVQTAIVGSVLASAPPPPHQGVFAQNWIDEGDAWSAYAAALAADPQAESAFTKPAAVPPAPPTPVSVA